MSVKLISLTQPIDQSFDHESIISYTARVSSPQNQANVNTAPKLLKYCLEHGHWSVFEHSNITIEIVTTLPIATQILRHKSFCFQQFSGRYAKSENFQKVKARRQDLKNRQNSVDDMSEETLNWFEDAQKQVIDLTSALYNEALDKGIAKECARFLLPNLTETKLYMTGNVRSFITYMMTRMDKSTQLEHREVALAIWGIFQTKFPVISEALKLYKPEVFL